MSGVRLPSPPPELSRPPIPLVSGAVCVLRGGDARSSGTSAGGTTSLDAFQSDVGASPHAIALKHPRIDHVRYPSRTHAQHARSLCRAHVSTGNNVGGIHLNADVRKPASLGTVAELVGRNLLASVKKSGNVGLHGVSRHEDRLLKAVPLSHAARQRRNVDPVAPLFGRVQYRPEKISRHWILPAPLARPLRFSYCK